MMDNMELWLSLFSQGFGYGLLIGLSCWLFGFGVSRLMKLFKHI